MGSFNTSFAFVLWPPVSNAVRDTRVPIPSTPSPGASEHTSTDQADPSGPYSSVVFRWLTPLKKRAIVRMTRSSCFISRPLSSSLLPDDPKSESLNSSVIEVILSTGSTTSRLASLQHNNTKRNETITTQNTRHRHRNRVRRTLSKTARSFINTSNSR